MSGILYRNMYKKQALVVIPFLEPKLKINETKFVTKRQIGSVVGQLVILQSDDQHLDDFKGYMQSS